MSKSRNHKQADHVSEKRTDYSDIPELNDSFWKMQSSSNRARFLLQSSIK